MGVKRVVIINGCVVMGGGVGVVGVVWGVAVGDDGRGWGLRGVMGGVGAGDGVVWVGGGL